MWSAEFLGEKVAQLLSSVPNRVKTQRRRGLESRIQVASVALSDPHFQFEIYR